jgi:Zn-dependent protease with chaperone function
MDAPHEAPQGVGAALGEKFLYLAGLIYLAGVSVMVVRLVIGRLRVGQIAAQATQMSAPDVPAFWVTDRSVGAFAYTPLSRLGGSKIVIPRTLIQSLSARELADIVRHEAAHIQRRDDEWGVVLRFILAVCWASPFVHMLFSRWTMSAETQSDMVVNYGHPQAQRRAYAQTLLKALKITASRVWQYRSPPSQPGTLGVKR